MNIGKRYMYESQNSKSKSIVFALLGGVLMLSGWALFAPLSHLRPQWLPEGLVFFVALVGMAVWVVMIFRYRNYLSHQSGEGD